MHTTTPSHFRSEEHYEAQKTLEDNYNNSIFWREQIKTLVNYQEGEIKKAKRNRIKALEKVVNAKYLLGYDTSKDRELIEEIGKS